ncbi:hypothetical protein [Microbacterium luticocti]|uniref:hypothetical protein n=1 Tax=Microbacterium luticocti TaxID=451764 RepID=UPI0004290A1D|nr:hypothetical protein [Microbacterium luticocti]
MVSFSWVHLLILLAAVAVVVLIVVLALRGWRRRGINVTVGVTLSGAAVMAAFSLIGAIVTLVNLLTTSQLSMTIPVQTFWPDVPGAQTGATGPAAIGGGGFTTADVQVDHVDAATRALWAIGQALGVLLPAVIAGLIALACFQLLRGAPFAPVVARAALITGLVVLVAGIGADVLSQWAGSMASVQALGQGAVVPDLPAGWDASALLPAPQIAITVPLWPIGAALGFGALSAVLGYGARLQRDTEGLV